MKMTKSKLNFLAVEICELKKFQIRQKLKDDSSIPEVAALNQTIISMERSFWYKYNNLKRK